MVLVRLSIKRLSAAKDGTQEDSASRMEQESRREQLEGEVKHLTQLLQGALRKQDEMALEAVDAWQMVRRKRSDTKQLLMLTVYCLHMYVCLKTDLTRCIHQARDNRAELEALQELLMSREKENQVLTSRLAEAQDAVCQLKQLVENHMASEREKNKRVRNNPVDNVGIPHLLEQYSGRFSMSSIPAAEPLFQVYYAIEWHRMLGI